jgi:hypothetical protein
MNRFYQLLIAIDQCLNCLIGSGYADETLSAYCYRQQDWRMKVIDAILWFDKDHCYNSYLSEIYRKQYPEAYR